MRIDLSAYCRPGRRCLRLFDSHLTKVETAVCYAAWFLSDLVISFGPPLFSTLFDLLKHDRRCTSSGSSWRCCRCRLAAVASAAAPAAAAPTELVFLFHGSAVASKWNASKSRDDVREERREKVRSTDSPSSTLQQLSAIHRTDRAGRSTRDLASRSGVRWTTIGRLAGWLAGPDRSFSRNRRPLLCCSDGATGVPAWCLFCRVSTDAVMGGCSSW